MLYMLNRYTHAKNINTKAKTNDIIKLINNCVCSFNERAREK